MFIIIIFYFGCVAATANYHVYNTQNIFYSISNAIIRYDLAVLDMSLFYPGTIFDKSFSLLSIYLWVTGS